jgi:hypothetical protein
MTMPNPSAEGRMSSQEDLFTEEDVDLLDHALVAADCVHGAIGPGHVGCTLACSRCIARKALTALAAAGRLLPLGTEHHEEWRVQRLDIESHAWDPWPMPSLHAAEVTADEAVWGEHARVERREIITWAGPWEPWTPEVDRSTE